MHTLSCYYMQLKSTIQPDNQLSFKILPYFDSAKNCFTKLCFHFVINFFAIDPEEYGNEK